MYEIVYIILAHKNPLQLKRLIGRLKTSASFFYVHVDLRSDIEAFQSVIEDERVVFIKKRVPCIWGDFSLVEATLNLIEKAIGQHVRGHCVLLSGQDYPVKPTSYIEEFLFRHDNTNFISLKKVEEVWSRQECDRRLKYYRINQSDRKGDYLILNRPDRKSVKMLFNNAISFRTFLRLFKTRKIDLELYGGSQWWAINFETLKKMYACIENNRKGLFRYFRHTNCADEIFFHTVVKQLEQSDETILLADSVTYANWQPENSFSPEIFTMDDLETLLLQPPNILFARKFDGCQNGGILDLMDAGGAT